MNRLTDNSKSEITLPLEYFLNPDYIYIPINDSSSNEIEKIAVKKNDLIYKNEYKNFYTPISGNIMGLSDEIKINNRSVKSIIIENDFKEQTSKTRYAKKYINDYKVNELMDLIKKYLPDLILNTKAKTILINGIDKEYSEKTYSYIISHNSDKLLETVDALSTILDIENIIFTINNKDNQNVINLTNNIGTYPNIKLKMMPDVYPIGFRNILIKNVLTKQQIEAGILYLTVEDLLNIYNVLKRRKPITEKFVTVGGNCIKNPIVIYTKIGVKIADLIKNKCEIINDNYYVIINGLISGITLESLNSIVTMDTRSIFLNTVSDEPEKKCINCGLCTMKCPVGLNPKYIKEHRKADRKRCINCGLCSYVCPSKINFKECLNEYEK